MSVVQLCVRAARRRVPLPIFVDHRPTLTIAAAFDTGKTVEYAHFEQIL
jgi:hypothetical protein